MRLATIVHPLHPHPLRIAQIILQHLLLGRERQCLNHYACGYARREATKKFSQTKLVRPTTGSTSAYAARTRARTNDALADCGSECAERDPLRAVGGSAEEGGLMQWQSRQKRRKINGLLVVVALPNCFYFVYIFFKYLSV